jgi:hypothetical protein
MKFRAAVRMQIRDKSLNEISGLKPTFQAIDTEPDKRPFGNRSGLILRRVFCT